MTQADSRVWSLVNRSRFSPWIFSLVAVALIALWQWTTIHVNYGGNRTALFCTGALQSLPPLAVSEHIYLFAGSRGFDGQFYHYIAHDPFIRSDLKIYIDDPRLRYHRILIPLLAYALALGHSGSIDTAYELICLLGIGLGVHWSCRFAQRTGLSAAWGLLFLAMPAIPVTMDRLVVDGGLAALVAAFLYYSLSPSWKLFVALACAALTRETGFLLAMAYCAHLIGRRRFRTAGIFLFSALPAAAWYWYVQTRTSGITYKDVSIVPFSSILQVLANPWKYPPGTPFAEAVVAGDYFALAGMLLGIGLTFYWFAKKPSGPILIAAALFATMAVLFQRTDIWLNVYSFGRVYTPLFVCLAALGAQWRKPWLLAPVVMMLPRLAIQLAPQALGVVHRVL